MWWKQCGSFNRISFCPQLKLFVWHLFSLWGACVRFWSVLFGVLEYDYGNENKKTSVLVAVIGQSVRSKQCGRCQRPFPGALLLSVCSFWNHWDRQEFIVQCIQWSSLFLYIDLKKGPIIIRFRCGLLLGDRLVF